LGYSHITFMTYQKKIVSWKYRIAIFLVFGAY
jgi:hypothetical protein